MHIEVSQYIKEIVQKDELQIITTMSLKEKIQYYLWLINDKEKFSDISCLKISELACILVEIKDSLSTSLHDLSVNIFNEESEQREKFEEIIETLSETENTTITAHIK